MVASCSGDTLVWFVKMAHVVLGRSKIIMFVVLVLAAFGVRAYLVAPQSIFPAMSFARIDVVADAGDLTPERVRIAVTRPLETAFGTLPSATRVRSTSTQGSAEILVDFDPATDPRADLQYVQGTIASLTPSLPAAKRIEAVVVNPNAEPVVSYGLTSRVLSQAALNSFVTSRIVPAFAGTPGLGRTSVVGGPPIEYRVELDPGVLAAVGLSAADVAGAVADAANVQSVGTAERYHQRYVILIDAAIHDARTLAAVGIPLRGGGTVRLGTLGSVRLGVGAPVAQAAVNGTHAVILNAFPLAGADAVSLARGFAARLAAVQGAFPADVAIRKYWDQTRLIVDSQTSLRDAILLGALLAIVVIYLFLRSVRMTLIAAAIIPLALAIAILALQRWGQSLNLMSVGGLAIAVGLIIDDAIVVIEAIARRSAEHPRQPHRQTIEAAVGTIAGAMAASTLTTVVVFVPLGLLSGVTGFFFRALAFTLAASLIVSLGLAIGVAPILANALLRDAPPPRAQPDRLHCVYRPILRWALTHRPAVYAAAAVILATTAVLLLQLPSDFLPKLDEGEFEIKYTLPAGATLADSDAAAGKLERVVLADADVESVGRLTGIDTNGFSPTLANTGTLRVALRAGGRASYDVISARLRDALGRTVPAASLDFHQLLEDQINDLSGTPQPIEITLRGPDQQTLIDAADSVTAAIAKVPGVVDSFDGVVYDDPSLRIAPQSARLGDLGISASDLGDALGARMQGAVAAQIPSESTTIPVNIRVAGRPGADALGGTALFTKGGPAVLSALAHIDRPPRASDINEENGRRIDLVTANIEGASLSAVVAGLKTALAHVALPPGCAAVIGGAYETQQASFREFLDVIAVAIVLVFSVMLATFGSFRLPLVILCAIPLALIGVAAALFVTRTPFNVSSFMGLLLLVGIVVKNGILLIDVANKRRAAGDGVTAALIVAGSTRVRPIVMTTLAAIGGLFPLALGLGSGAEMERPLAIAVIGGLSTATAFTLVLIPVLYATFVGASRRGAPLRPAVATLLVFALPLMLTRAVSAEPPAGAVAAGAAATLRFAQVDLAAAQQLAVAESPDVHVAQAALDGARAGLAQARAADGVSLVGGYVEAPQGAPGGPIAQRLTTYGAQLTLGDVAAYAPLVSQAAASVRAAETDALAAERAERVKTIGLYYAALTARAIRGARADAVDSAQRQLAAAQTRFNAGDAPRLDIVRAQVGLAHAQGDLANADAADGSATDALAREVGRPAAAFAVTDPAPAPADLVIPAPDTAVAQALARRADLRSAEANVRASRAGVAAARTGVLPAVTLNGGYARGIDSGFATNGPTLSAQLSIPLGGGVAARVHAQTALLAAAAARRAGIERAVALEVGAAARNAAAAVTAETAATTALTAARAELDAVTLGYDRGASNSLDVSSARTTYVQAAVDALSAGYARLQAQAVLALEVGS
jgi:multidrug efflux pump subunit AcrB/outer membrane protein TolC